MTPSRIAFGVVLAVIVVVSAELAARLDDRIRLGVPFWATPEFTRDLFLTDSLGFRGKPHGRFKRFKLNAFGFRGEEIARAPAPGCTRILVLGASESFGTTESDGKQYPAQLGDSLRRHGCYEVVNGAIVGIGLPGMITLWENWASRFGASIVLVYPSPAFYLGTEPPRPTQPTVAQRDTTAPAAAPADAGFTFDFTPRLIERARDVIEVPGFLQRRRVARALERETADRDSTWFWHRIPEDRLAQYTRDLDSLLTAIRARGAQPALVTHANRFGDAPPPREQAMLTAWRVFTPRAMPEVILAFERAAADSTRAVAARQGAVVIDAARRMNGVSRWFADQVHFTDEGAGVLAGTLARGLLPALQESRSTAGASAPPPR